MEYKRLNLILDFIHRNFDKALEALKRNHTRLERILKGILSLNHEDDVQELLDDAVKLGNAIKELETIEE